jgi:hypothetical protein
MLELMEWLAERGVTTVFKVDGDRMDGHRQRWAAQRGLVLPR